MDLSTTFPSEDAGGKVEGAESQQQPQHLQTILPRPPPPPPIPAKYLKLTNTSSSLILQLNAKLSPKKSKDFGSGSESHLPDPPPPPPLPKIPRVRSKSRKDNEVKKHEGDQSEELYNEIKSQSSNKEALSSLSEPSTKLDDTHDMSPVDSFDARSRVSSVTPRSVSSLFSRPSWFRKNKRQGEAFIGNFSLDASEKTVELYYPPAVVRSGKDILVFEGTTEASLKDEDSVYYGERMEVGLPTSNNQLKVPSNLATPRVGFIEKTTSWIRRTASSSSHSSRGTRIKNVDSLADFHESEWTPQDSSYGAAIPLGGWIPKHIRRRIESTMIILGIVCFVYVVVATSIRVTDDRKKHQNSTKNYFYSDGSEKADQFSGCLILDDDNYIAYTDDCITDDSISNESYYSKNNND